MGTSDIGLKLSVDPPWRVAVEIHRKMTADCLTPSGGSWRENIICNFGNSSPPGLAVRRARNCSVRSRAFCQPEAASRQQIGRSALLEHRQP